MNIAITKTFKSELMMCDSWIELVVFLPCSSPQPVFPAGAASFNKPRPSRLPVFCPASGCLTFRSTNICQRNQQGGSGQSGLPCFTPFMVSKRSYSEVEFGVNCFIFYDLLENKNQY